MWATWVFSALLVIPWVSFWCYLALIVWSPLLLWNCAPFLRTSSSRLPVRLHARFAAEVILDSRATTTTNIKYMLSNSPTLFLLPTLYSRVCLIFVRSSMDFSSYTYLIIYAVSSSCSFFSFSAVVAVSSSCVLIELIA